MNPISEIGRYGMEKARRIEWSHCRRIEYDWLVGGPSSMAWMFREQHKFRLDEFSRQEKIREKMLANESLPLLGFDETTVRTLLQQLNMTWREIQNDPEWAEWIEKHKTTRTLGRFKFANQVYSKKSLLEAGPAGVKLLANHPIP